MIALNLKSLFFENRSLKQTIFKNLSWFSLSELITRILSFALVIFIARILGAEDYGLLTFAISISATISVLTFFCSDSIIIREFNLKDKSSKELGSVLGLRIILGLIAFLVIIISSFFVKPEAHLLVSVFAFVVLLDAVTTYFKAIFIAVQKIEYIALIEIFKTSSLVLGGFLILFNFPNIYYISFAYLLGNIVAFIFGFLGLKKLISFPKLALNWNIYKKYFYYSLPLFLGAVLNIIYVQIDSVMMGFWGMLEEVGWYQASYKIINFFTFFAIVRVVLFPAVTNAFSQTREYFQMVVNKFFELVMFIAFPVMVGGFLLSEEIILFLYGKNFTPSILAFKILIPITGLTLFVTLVESVLTTIGRQKYVFYLTGPTAALNIVLNIVLIPRYSLYGAGVATLLSYIFLFLFSLIVLKRVRINLKLKMVVNPLLSVLVMAAFLFFAKERHVLLQVFIGGAVYLFVFYFLFRIQKRL
jgi:O-antigen/teichoic acid export membrane protein